MIRKLKIAAFIPLALVMAFCAVLTDLLLGSGIRLDHARQFLSWLVTEPFYHLTREEEEGR